MCKFCSTKSYWEVFGKEILLNYAGYTMQMLIHRVFWPQLFAFSRRQTCSARKNWEHAFVRCLMYQVAWFATKIFSCFGAVSG